MATRLSASAPRIASSARPTLARTKTTKCQSTLGLLQATSDAFLAADVNGDKCLSFEEFVNIVPEEMRLKTEAETLQELFEHADADGDGTVTLEECASRMQSTPRT